MGDGVGVGEGSAVGEGVGVRVGPGVAVGRGVLVGGGVGVGWTSTAARRSTKASPSPPLAGCSGSSVGKSFTVARAVAYDPAPLVAARPTYPRALYCYRVEVVDGMLVTQQEQ